MLHTISLLNRSTVAADDEIVEIAHALQRQVNRDFRPVWGTNAAVIPVAHDAKPVPGSWWLVVLDTMDEAGALGYHDLTKDLQPIGKIGAQTDIEYGAKLSVTCSHELLEMLGDPLINQLVEDPDTNRIYAFENCDAVEADDLGYDIDGVTVSDFVLPSYFDVNEEGRGNSLSFRGNVHTPFELAPGGYLSYREVGQSEWKQVTAQDMTFSPEDTDDSGSIGVGPDNAPRFEGKRAAGFPEGSRRERRLRASKGELQVSTALV